MWKGGHSPTSQPFPLACRAGHSAQAYPMVWQHLKHSPLQSLDISRQIPAPRGPCCLASAWGLCQCFLCGPTHLDQESDRCQHGSAVPVGCARQGGNSSPFPPKDICRGAPRQTQLLKPHPTISKRQQCPGSRQDTEEPTLQTHACSNSQSLEHCPTGCPLNP